LAISLRQEKEPAMSDDSPFDKLIRRVRAGDQDAAAELVRQYESFIRRTVRFRLVDDRLRAVFDSMDICQSVLGSFFVRAAAGQYDLDSPAQLTRLLVNMARNKLASQARKEHAERRDNRRVAGGDVDAANLPAPDPSPSQQVASEELLRQVQDRLTPHERQLVELRNQGRDWASIADELGGDPVALRKQLSRALDRVTRQLGIEDDHD
jgi:RNA polymerase sigma-70 factor (ECF subfamily)